MFFFLKFNHFKMLYIHSGFFVFKLYLIIFTLMARLFTSLNGLFLDEHEMSAKIKFSRKNLSRKKYIFYLILIFNWFVPNNNKIDVKGSFMKYFFFKLLFFLILINNCKNSKDFPQENSNSSPSKSNDNNLTRESNLDINQYLPEAKFPMKMIGFCPDQKEPVAILELNKNQQFSLSIHSGNDSIPKNFNQRFDINQESLNISTKHETTNNNKPIEKFIINKNSLKLNKIDSKYICSFEKNKFMNKSPFLKCNIEKSKTNCNKNTTIFLKKQQLEAEKSTPEDDNKSPPKTEDDNKSPQIDPFHTSHTITVSRKKLAYRDDLNNISYIIYENDTQTVEVSIIQSSSQFIFMGKEIELLEAKSIHADPHCNKKITYDLEVSQLVGRKWNKKKIKQAKPLPCLQGKNNQHFFEPTLDDFN